MEIRQSLNRDISFRSRCVQIRDAQWVCHKINTELPHCSCTKIKPMIVKQLNKISKKYLRENELSIDMYKLYDEICQLGLTAEDYENLNLIQKMMIKFSNAYIYTKEDKHVLRILKKAKEFIDRVGEKRTVCSKFSNKIQNSLVLLQAYKLGNCRESALAAEMILKMNGVKNAMSVGLSIKNGKKHIDHIVCAFNRDGRELKAINRDTIIVDPWLNKVDFAHNMFKFYKSEAKHWFGIPENEKIVFDEFNNSKISKLEILRLRNKYPEFVFDSLNREFMSNTVRM